MSMEMIKKHRFVGILRHIAPEYAAQAAQAMYDGGIRIFEVTFAPSQETTVDDTKRIIKTIGEMFGEKVCVGAGTVLTVEFAKAAYEAGAKFIVSPCTDPEVVAYTKKMGLLSIPGAFSPTEIQQAYKMGADVVKIFPIGPNDEAYLKNVISPLSHIPFMVTGGINPDTIDKFLAMGPVAVAAGATIVTKELVENGKWDVITENARRHIEGHL